MLTMPEKENQLQLCPAVTTPIAAPVVVPFTDPGKGNEPRVFVPRGRAGQNHAAEFKVHADLQALIRRYLFERIGPVLARSFLQELLHDLQHGIPQVLAPVIVLSAGTGGLPGLPSRLQGAGPDGQPAPGPAA